MNTLSCHECADRLLDGHTLLETQVDLVIGDWCGRIRSNSKPLLERLSRYFATYLTSSTAVDAEIIAIERSPTDLGLTFIDWRREPGKTGRKDSYVDLADGRLVRKVRTGMLFLQHREWRIAAGPCLAFDNQVINFVNAQYMNHLQQHGWLICHAAALVTDHRAIAIAGLSGGGKSTLMLQAMEQPQWQFLTNDRLFIQRAGAEVACRGIAKMPRINPGTLLHHPRLKTLLDADRVAELQSLPQDTLWSLEDKHDVMVADHYGEERIAQHARLTALLVLNWSRDTYEATRFQRVDLTTRSELLDAVMKSPGPFYQYSDGHFLADTTPLDRSPYLSMLNGTAVFEATGRIDFERAATELRSLVGHDTGACQDA